MNFKIHFQQAFDELNETGQLTLQQTGYENMNLVDEVVSRVANEVQAQLNSIQESVTPAPAPTLTSNNSTAQHITIDTLIQQQQEILRIFTSSGKDRGNRGNRGSRGRSTVHTGPREGQSIRPLPAWCNKYCWKHGKSSHHSANCNNKAPGHRDDATFENKMGGSTYGCE